MQNGKDLKHVYARPPAGRGRSLPESPIESPSGRYSRTKSGRLPGPGPGTGGGFQSRPLFVRLIALFLTWLFRRHAVLLIFPLIYVSGMLCTGRTRNEAAFSFRPPGSEYRSAELFEKLWPEMENGSIAGSSFGVERAWQFTSSTNWQPCFSRDNDHEVTTGSNGYLIVEANGGLNQQRSSICNAVAVAFLLNATLVIPRFHLNSVWHDNSTFGEIYDENHFIDSLAHDVRIVHQLPDEILQIYGNLSNIYNFRIKAWSLPDFYLEKVLPKLLETGVVRFTPFANRLSYEEIPPKAQQLRCRANFEALRFAEPITSLAEKAVKRMIAQSYNSDGKYIGVHLRYEMDMVAFSCCTYDGGAKEKIEMDAARERGWRGKFTRPGREINPGKNRRDGKCPLTPLEVGMILRGMGFSKTTPIYLAAGKIYEAEKNMAPLRQMFPFLHTKETLLSAEELEPLKKYSSRMAALDYSVCLHSEVFVSTQGGNFPQLLTGHRRFLNKGHSKTIRPDKRKLALLLDNPSISWEEFSEHLQTMRLHNDQKGHELRKGNSSVYTFPAPDCMCPVDAVADEVNHFENAMI